jgi:hypothetical protein
MNEPTATMHHHHAPAHVAHSIQAASGMPATEATDQPMKTKVMFLTALRRRADVAHHGGRLGREHRSRQAP